MSADNFDSVRLLAVRHAQQQSFKQVDPPLTDLGKRQSAALAEALAAETIDRSISSTMARAAETASLLHLPLPTEGDDRLKEFDFGPAGFHVTGSREDLEFWRPEHGAPGGETLSGFHERVSEFMEELVGAAEGNTTTILVTHTGVIDIIGRWIFGIGGQSPWTTEIEAPHASVTEFVCWPQGRHPGGAPRYHALRRPGDVQHLDESMITGL